MDSSDLRENLTNKEAPLWLRLFARFELLNGRGEQARNAALAAFEGEPTAALLEKDITLTNRDFPILDPQLDGFPKEVHVQSTARTKTGQWWAAFFCEYLGSESDLWLAQSTDGKRWTRPMFCMNLKARCRPGRQPGTATIQIDNDIMELTWQEYIDDIATSGKTVPHYERLQIADIVRDSDGDGLTDLLEKEIGTDLHNPDTNGNGIPDNRDKNATYKAHPQTDEEGIFQAAVEALCQVGKASGRAAGTRSAKPVRFGACQRPLILHLPAGSKGVKVIGHPGPVIARAIRTGREYPSILVSGMTPGGDDYVFVRPHIDLAGFYHDIDERRRDSIERAADPFSASYARVSGPSSVHVPTFRDYFPYVRSADGMRTRIGWEQSEGSPGDSVEIGFDIEVRKIDGHWYPIECRQVYTVGRHGGDEAVIPQVRVQGAH